MHFKTLSKLSNLERDFVFILRNDKPSLVFYFDFTQRVHFLREHTEKLKLLLLTMLYNF